MKQKFKAPEGPPAVFWLRRPRHTCKLTAVDDHDAHKTTQPPADRGKLLRHKAVLSGGPIEITLESTAKCNLYCPMCPRHIYTFDNENMDLELYKKMSRTVKTTSNSCGRMASASR